MSMEFRKSYTAFQRHILAEFMSKKQLVALDKKYNKAKFLRIEKRYLKSEK